MIARKYETRLDKDGLVTFEKVWSKHIPIVVNLFTYPENIYELCKALKLDNYSEEHIFLLIFDIKMHFKSFIEIGIGSDHECFIDKRGIAQKVLMLNAGAFVIVHNHPSGDSTPSSADFKTFNTIHELGIFIGIPLEDMFILGDDTYYSFAESNKKKQEGEI